MSEIKSNEIVMSAKDIGRIVSARRKSLSLTQIDVAGLGQTGNRFIVDLEKGKATLQFDKVMHILDLLGLDVVIMERGKS